MGFIYNSAYPDFAECLNDRLALHTYRPWILLMDLSHIMPPHKKTSAEYFCKINYSSLHVVLCIAYCNY